MATNDRIFLTRPDEDQVKDGISDVSIDPGHVVEIGGSNDIQKQSSAGGDGEKAVAMVNRAKHGKVSDSWASGDTVEYAIAQSGDEVQVRLGSGSAEHNISKGEQLEFAGDGTVQSQGTAGSGNHTKFVALEALDNSGGSSEKLIKARAV